MQQSRLSPAVFMFFSMIAAISLLPACTDAPSRPRTDRPSGDGGMLGPRPVEGCDPAVDSDGDGIGDAAETNVDADGDGIPNHLDEDSDGDGISDRDEHMSSPACVRPDADGDGIANWLDTDSDNDGLPDSEERSLGTDPYNRDSDNDGVTDLAEVRGTGTDPNDSTSTISPDDFFVVLPYQGERVNRTLRFGTNIHQADVYFLIDTTGSMGVPLENVRTSLTRIASELSTRIRDVQMGVGHFQDFPFSGNCGLFDIACAMRPVNYGADTDRAYIHVQDITNNLGNVQSALNGLALGNGTDLPESHVEALYQTATGEGGSWSWNGRTHSIAPRTCPAIPDEPATRRGYPCFRAGSLPIIVLVSDVQFHNGPGGSAAYREISPTPHSFEQATAALGELGARVVGVSVPNTRGSSRPDQEAVARMTGSVDGSGRPLVYDAAGGEVSDAIIEGIGTLVGGTPQDVTTTTENVAGNPDDVDARGFIKSIVTVEGYSRDGVPGARPGISYTSRDESTFYGVVPGTLVDFAVDFHNDFVEPPATTQIYRATIVVMGNGVARLDERQVFIVVPPDGAIVLI